MRYKIKILKKNEASEDLEENEDFEEIETNEDDEENEPIIGV